MSERAPTVTPAEVTKALQLAWNDWTSDTGCYPDCFKVERGPRLVADFAREPNFTAAVAAFLNNINDQQK